MRRGGIVWTLIVLLAGTWLGGCSCTGSLAPLKSSEPLTFTPDLSGQWVGKDADSAEQTTILLESAGENIYRASAVSPSSEKMKVYCLLSLVQIGSYTFADVRFEKVADEMDTLDESDLGVEPIHFIGKIEVDGETLRFRILDYHWLREMALSGNLKLPYVERNKGGDQYFILTAESDALGEFVRQYAEDTEAFTNTVIFQRVPPDGGGSNGEKP